MDDSGTFVSMDGCGWAWMGIAMFDTLKFVEPCRAPLSPQSTNSGDSTAPFQACNA